MEGTQHAPHSARIRLVRWKNYSPEGTEMEDCVAVEEPLELRIQGESISVTMRTPGHDQELAAGFLLCEGLIERPEQIVDLAYCPRADHESESNILNIFLEPGSNLDLKRLSRHVFAHSSCGICGKASIEAVQQQFPPVSSLLEVKGKTLVALPERLRAVQRLFEETGGLHGAGLFEADGTLLLAREDVGRHNAVDKVLGWALLHSLVPLSKQILLVSGRVSFEIMQKALAARIPVVAAVSAPSSLAVEFAQESGQTLAGFIRGANFNVYAHPERVVR